MTAPLDSKLMEDDVPLQLMVHVSEVAVSLLEEIVIGVISFDKGLLTGVAALFPSGVPLLVPGYSLATAWKRTIIIIAI